MMSIITLKMVHVTCQSVVSNIFKITQCSGFVFNCKASFRQTMN